MFDAPRPRFVVLAAAALAAFVPVLRGQQAEIIQTLEGFYSPSAAVFAADGRTLFVANSAMGDFGMIAGRGAISRVAMAGDGTLSVEKQRFIVGLNAPLGLAVLPGAVGPYPAGTLAVTVGHSWTVDLDGHRLGDDQRGVGVVFFDPTSGQELGRLLLGIDSPIARMLGHAVVDPGAVALDPTGNLYLADAAGSEWRPDELHDVRPGVLKIAPAAVAAVAAGETPPAGSAEFAYVPDVATGLAYSAKEDALYWVTANARGDLAGAIVRLPHGDFSGGAALETLAKEQNSLSSLCLTPAGSVVVARNGGDIWALRGRGKPRLVKFADKRQRFLSPGQLAVSSLADGRLVVVLPESSGAGSGIWRHRVQVFTLPAGF